MNVCYNSKFSLKHPWYTHDPILKQPWYTKKKLCQDWEVLVMFKIIGRHIKFQKYIAGPFCICPEKMCFCCFDILVKLILFGIYFLYYCRSFYMCYTISNFYPLLHLVFREIILITAKDEFCKNFLLIFT